LRSVAVRGCELVRKRDERLGVGRRFRSNGRPLADVREG
jgi:hypothetical protein